MRKQRGSALLIAATPLACLLFASLAARTVAQTYVPPAPTDYGPAVGKAYDDPATEIVRVARFSGLQLSPSDGARAYLDALLGRGEIGRVTHTLMVQALAQHKLPCDWYALYLADVLNKQEPPFPTAQAARAFLVTKNILLENCRPGENLTSGTVVGGEEYETPASRIAPGP